LAADALHQHVFINTAALPGIHSLAIPLDIASIYCLASIVLLTYRRPHQVGQSVDSTLRRRSTRCGELLDFRGGSSA